MQITNLKKKVLIAGVLVIIFLFAIISVYAILKQNYYLVDGDEINGSWELVRVINDGQVLFDVSPESYYNSVRTEQTIELFDGYYEAFDNCNDFFGEFRTGIDQSFWIQNHKYSNYEECSDVTIVIEIRTIEGELISSDEIPLLNHEEFVNVLLSVEKHVSFCIVQEQRGNL